MRLTRIARRFRIVLALFAAACGFRPAAAASIPPLLYRADQVTVAPHAMVVCEQPLAARAGADVLRAGGNAVDAAVAAALTLGVVHPQAGNLGGGGFLLYYRARDGFTTFVDFRETAPGSASANMYLNAAGDVDTVLSRTGPGAAGIPGSPAGLYLTWLKYGSRPWRSLVAPALRFAQEGFTVNEDLSAAVASRAGVLRRYPQSAALFLPKGRPLRTGEKLVQKDLARTLRLIAQSGALTFYEGSVAALLTKPHDGEAPLFDAADLERYRAVERVPLRGRYRDLEIVAAPPPSSGGATLLEILGLLETVDLQAMEPRGAARIHVTSEAMARAFADRNHWLGDSDFVRNPLTGLLHPDYLAARRQGIDGTRATAAAAIRPGDPWRYEPATVQVVPLGESGDSLRLAPTRMIEGNHTTHLSVVDANGDIVTLTTTLNDEMGGGYVVPGAGFLLNNEMDDFVAKPGQPNMYGLVGSDTNAIAPGKRPLSSMSPVIVLRDGKPWLVLGSRGGPRIITNVLNILLDMHAHGMTLQAAVAAPRFHDQWLPDEILHEPGAISDPVRTELQAMGHALRERSRYSAAQCIELTPEGARRGVSDPRARGAAIGY